MSIAYQSWEVGSGPTVGYKVQPHQAAAAAADGFAFRKLNIYRPPPPHLPLPQNQPQHLDAPSTSRTAPRLGSSDASSRADDGCLARLVPEGGGTSSSRSSRSSGSLDVGVGSSVSLTVAPSPSPSPPSPGRGASLEDGTDMPCSSSSLVTSSISEDSSDESDEKEVESAFKGPLEQMDSLMTNLPIRRGLSKFYVGKSRSFTSLADVKPMSIKDLAKPENPYARRRKLPTHREGLDKPRFPPPRVSTGIAKKPITSNATTLTLAVAMSTKGEDVDDCLATGRRWQKSCRSFSLTDLQKA